MSMSSTLRIQVERELNNLGGSAREIAAKLGREAVRGEAHSADGCVLAQYLNERFPSHYFVVGPLWVDAYEKCGAFDGCGIYGMHLSRALRGFIKNFDRKSYSFLLRPTVVEKVRVGSV